MFRNEGSEEQYEGGRVANRRDEREYRNTDDDYHRDDNAEAAKMATKLVQDELKRRAAVRRRLKDPFLDYELIDTVKWDSA
jgi:hypothetical protein